MQFYFKRNGVYDAYSALGTVEQKHLLVRWWAQELTRRDAKNESTRNFSSSTATARLFNWKSKTWMVDELRPAKAQNKIGSGALVHQPDPDTNKDGKWDREYHIWIVTGGKREVRIKPNQT